MFTSGEVDLGFPILEMVSVLPGEDEGVSII